MKTSLKNQGIRNHPQQKFLPASVGAGDLVKWRENVRQKIEKNNLWNLDWQQGRNTGLILKIWGSGFAAANEFRRFGFTVQASVLWQDGSISETSTSCLEKLDVL